jgi:hypothetical protein
MKCTFNYIISSNICQNKIVLNYTKAFQSFPYQENRRKHKSDMINNTCQYRDTFTSLTHAVLSRWSTLTSRIEDEK